MLNHLHQLRPSLVHLSLSAGVALAVAAAGANSAEAAGFWNMPSNLRQSLGMGVGPGYHAPLALGRTMRATVAAQPVKRMPHAPIAPAACQNGFYGEMSSLAGSYQSMPHLADPYSSQPYDTHQGYGLPQHAGPAIPSYVPIPTPPAPAAKSLPPKPPEVMLTKDKNEPAKDAPKGKRKQSSAKLKTNQVETIPVPPSRNKENRRRVEPRSPSDRVTPDPLPLPR